MLTPEQSRMARAGLGLGVRDIAAMAKVSPNTISRLERGERLNAATAQAIRLAFEAAGIEFLDPNGDGPGVKIKRGAT